MFSFKKITSPAVTVMLTALLLPCGSFAEETGAKAAAKPAEKGAAKPGAKAAAKPAAKAAAKPAAKEKVKEQVKTPAPQEQAKVPAVEQAKEQPAADPATVTVAKVNGIAITRLEVNRALKVMLAQNQVQQPLPAETMKQAEAAALDQLAAAELLYQEASKLTIADLDKRIVDKVAQNRAKFDSETEFIEALKGVDMTPEDMKDFTRKDIIINNFIEQQFAAKAAVTEAEARKFYDENVEEYFKKPESVKASHILISVDDKATDDQRKKAKEKAEALLKRVKAGEDFAAVAKSDSACPSSAQGGDLGTFGRGQMVAPFENAAFAMKPGEVSGVVETQFGYHIIKLVEKQEGATEKFESAREKISDFLKRQKVQQELSAFITDLKKTATIEKM